MGTKGDLTKGWQLIKGMVMAILLTTGCQPSRPPHGPRADSPIAAVDDSSRRSTPEQQSKTDEDDTAGAQVESPVHSSVPKIPLDRLGLAGHDRPDVIDDDRWQAEKWSGRVSQQLDRIGRFLVAENAAVHELESVVADDFQPLSALRPKKLRLIYSRSRLKIWRTADSTPPAPTHSPAAESNADSAEVLARALSQLRKPLADASDRHNHFKLFRVKLTGANRISTRALFEQRFKQADRILQQRALWDCVWIFHRGSMPRLISIRVSDYEEAVATLVATERRAVPRHTPDTARASLQPLLSDITQSVLGQNSSFAEQLAVSTDYWIDRLEFRYGIDPGAWLGLAVADVNGDGLDDVYFCQPGGLPNRLFIQQSDGTAVDRSRELGVDWLDHTHAALFADLDNDADQDLVLAVKPGLLFLANDGTGSMTLKAVRPIPTSRPYALSAIDYNHDSRLDIYVACYSQRSDGTDRFFIQRPVPYHDANNGGRNQLMQNSGGWRFDDVTRRVGLDQNNRRFSFAAAWEDYDNDGDCDLYVANDYGRNNLYRNDGGRFVDVAAEAGVEDISAGMSVTWGDYNRDGWVDLYVSNMFSSAGNRITYQRTFRTSDSRETRQQYQRHAKGNSLFLNAGDGTFKDVSEPTRTTIGRWAWGSKFVDLDNNGWDDLLVANGFITQEDTRDL